MPKKQTSPKVDRQYSEAGDEPRESFFITDIQVENAAMLKSGEVGRHQSVRMVERSDNANSPPLAMGDPAYESSNQEIASVPKSLTQRENPNKKTKTNAVINSKSVPRSR